MLGRWRGYWFSGLRSDPCYHRQHVLQERNLLHFPTPLRELRGYHVEDALDTWCCEASFALRGPARHRLGMRLGGRQGCRCRNKCCVCLLSHARRMCDGARDRVQVQLKGSHAPFDLCSFVVEALALESGLVVRELRFVEQLERILHFRLRWWLVEAQQLGLDAF